MAQIEKVIIPDGKYFAVKYLYYYGGEILSPRNFISGTIYYTNVLSLNDFKSKLLDLGIDFDKILTKKELKQALELDRAYLSLMEEPPTTMPHVEEFICIDEM